MVKVKKRDVARHLRESAKRIEKYGFNKGIYGSTEIGFCALGAIGQGTTPGPLTSPSARALQQFVYNEQGFVYVDVFNDLEETTAEDVTSLMRRTARALEHGMEIEF